MDAMIGSLRSINRGDDGSSSELRRLEAALQSLQDREGNTSQRSATAIIGLAELMDHDNRVQRLLEGKFELLGNYQTLFLNLLRPTLPSCSGRPEKQMKSSRLMCGARYDGQHPFMENPVCALRIPSCEIGP